MKETIPEPISLTDALKLRASKEKELLEDPATAAPSAVHTPTPSIAPSAPQALKAKGKARQTADKPAESVSATEVPPPKKPRQRKSHATASTAESTPNSAPPQPMQVVRESASTGGMTTRRRSSRAAAADATPPIGPGVNGHRSGPNGVQPPPQFLHPSAAAASMPPPPTDDRHVNGASWPTSHFTGPASGYIEDNRGSLSGRNGINGMGGNPGRTIYSAQRQQNR